MDIVLNLFDPFALALVWIGAIMVIGLQEGYSGFIKSVVAWRILLRADPMYDAQLARQALQRVERIIDLKGIHCIDRVSAENDFIVRAINNLAQGTDLSSFVQWVSADLDDREARHNKVIRFWLAVADIAPAIGMVGTLIGLVKLFAQIGDGEALGAAMSLALLTTLYGLILANIIASPISQRFLRLSSEELKWQRIMADKLIALAQADKKIHMQVRDRKHAS